MKHYSLYLALALSLPISSALAHSEHDKARFVAEQGHDQGRCDNVLRPCKTIAYAVKQANKGDKILVAAGNYPINSSEELFYLQSDIVPVSGGFNRFDHFQNQSPNTNLTSLTGVPQALAQNFRAKGFHVINDGKVSINTKAFAEKLAAYNELSQNQAQTACANGKAETFSCNNVDLYAHMALSSFSTKPATANDIWGHVDLNSMREYAIIGLRNGVAVVDVTDPANPNEVGTVSGLNSTWRDIKVYQYFDEMLNAWQAYAYATIDQTSDKVTIIDLNNLPNSVSLVEKSAVVNVAHNVYISNVDPTLNTALPGETPVLQLTGANKFGGAFHSYSLANPRTLTAIPSKASGSGYTHDGASITINDDRATTSCVAKQAPCTVFLDFNEKEIKLWDITDASNTTLLGTGEYNDVPKSNQYVHSGWGSEDQNYVFVHDEFDEIYSGINSTVRIFSIADLTNPTQVGQWTGPTAAIDHNGFVRGSRYYMSNYERGFTVLDISDPANPTETGFFDTFTPSNNASFNGAWGVYPFLPSGTILVSDIGSGLYVLKDNTTTSTKGQIHFTSNQVSANRGESLSLSINRDNITDNQAVTVGYQVLPGSAKANQDFTAANGTLSWAAGDNSAKNIVIDIPANDQALANSFFVRLFNPTNGATLSSPSYIKVKLAGKAYAGAFGFTQNNTQIDENHGNLTLNVARVGGVAGTATVHWKVTSGTAITGQDVEAAEGDINWADGDNSNKSIDVAIIDDNSDEDNETFTVELSLAGEGRLATNSSISVTIKDDDTNTAPTINMPEDFEVNTGQTVNLTATATDAENDTLSYDWQQTAGTNVTINNGTTAQASFVAPDAAGTLSFRLTVTDSKQATNSKTVNINVVAPTPTPTPTPVPPANNSSSGGGSGHWLVLLSVITFISRRKRRGV